MAYKWLGLVCLGLLTVASFIVFWSTSGAQAATAAVTAPLPTATINGIQPPRPKLLPTPGASTTASLDNLAATCYRPVADTGICYIEWAYLYMTTDPSHYVISMTVTINGRVRAYYSGFFQNYMYVPSDMQYPGFKVTCGRLGASGIASLGETYDFAIKGRDTANNTPTSAGRVTCPADLAKIYLPMIRR